MTKKDAQKVGTSKQSYYSLTQLKTGYTNGIHGLRDVFAYDSIIWFAILLWSF